MSFSRAAESLALLCTLVLVGTSCGGSEARAESTVGTRVESLEEVQGPAPGEEWQTDSYSKSAVLAKQEPDADQESETAPEPEQDSGSEENGKDEEQDKEEPRPGIPVTNELVRAKCMTCHPVSDEGHMTRISYMRKTPEGWELSIKRMLRRGWVELTPLEAKEMVRYLANDHGLARAEAERALYEVERRVHWSEAEHDKALLETCGECHTLGRVLSEQRDKKEWSYLKATHLAYFPLAQWQAFRSRGARGEVDWESLTEAEAEARWDEMNRVTRKDRADEVLGKLAEQLPLFTPEWEAWQVNRREVPLAGTWTVVGHEAGRGDVRGSVTITRTAEDEYATRWELSYGDEAPLVRAGKSLLYAGYSWRGRSTTSAPGEPPALREVLLLSDDWSRMRGRVFTGGYNELGADVTLHRRTGAPAIFAVQDGAVMIPSRGHVLEVLGADLPERIQPADFHLGEGVTVTAVRRASAERVTLTVDVERGAERGARMLSFRNLPGPQEVVLYDTVDYIKIVPEEGFARTGGSQRPKQMERFDAVAMNRGRDDKPYTEDDFKIRYVPAQWQLEEFPVREDDDDVEYVGTIDARTGVFTPELDGPNTERRWDANNIGDVYVVATCTLTVQDVPKKKETEEPADGPPVMRERLFRARGHLLVAVPLYVRWDRYEWDQR